MGVCLSGGKGEARGDILDGDLPFISRCLALVRGFVAEKDSGAQRGSKSPVEVDTPDWRRGNGSGVDEERGRFVGGWLPGCRCCTVDRCDGELSCRIWIVRGNRQTLQEVIRVGFLLEVETIGDGESLVDGDVVGRFV